MDQQILRFVKLVDLNKKVDKSMKIKCYDYVQIDNKIISVMTLRNSSHGYTS